MRRPIYQLRRGFTLLEVMFSIVIATIATAAMYTIFTWQSQELLTQDLKMQMNQNIRFAGDILGRGIRLAGYNADGYVGVFGPNGVADEDDELPVLMSWDDPDGDDGPDAITLVYGDPSLVMDTQNDIVEECGTTSLSFRPYKKNPPSQAGPVCCGRVDALLRLRRHAGNRKLSV